MADVADPEATSTLYINKHFEIRDHDAPTKYVWNGETRVGRVTGSISTNLRVQHLRLFPGWNLISLGVSAPQNTFTNFVAYYWHAPTSSWLPLAPHDSISAGRILWLKATASATISISGPYVPPTNVIVHPPGEFVGSPGFELWNIKSAISNFLFVTASTYDAASLHWLSSLPPPLAMSKLPSFLSPGSAIFIQTEDAIQLEIPDSDLHLRYYHPDHLGSSSAMTDAVGDFAEENTYYAFGTPRNGTRWATVEDAYFFAQKESDRESTLAYFEARYCGAFLSRFTSVDPLKLNILPQVQLEQVLRDPSRLHPYAYALNNPTRYVDPSGCSPNYASSDTVARDLISKILDTAAQRWRLVSFNTLSISQRDLRQIAEAYRTALISVQVGERAALRLPSTGDASYNLRDNRLRIPLDHYLQLHSVLEQSLMVHESVHAILDKRKNGVLTLEDEALAYVAQAAFLLNNSTSLTQQDRNTISRNPFLSPAMVYAKALSTGDKGLQKVAQQQLEDAIKNTPPNANPYYYNWSDVRHYNGVPNTP